MKVFCEVHGWLTLSAAPVAGGGMANVYTTDKPGVLVKLYHAGFDFTDLTSRTSVISKSIDGVRGVCLLFGTVSPRPSAPPVGISMQRIKGRTLEGAKFRTRGQRRRTANDMAYSFAALNARGVTPSDPHPGNVMVSPLRRRATLIDCDSFSHGPVTFPDGTTRPVMFKGGTKSWSAPELIGASDPTHNEATASYSLGCLIYRTLKDHHPAVYGRKSGGTIDSDRGVDEGCVGVRDASKLPAGWLPLDKGIPFRALPDRLQHMFDQTFGRGFSNPGARPSLDEWAEVMRSWCRGKALRRWVLVGALTAGAVIGGAKYFPSNQPGTTNREQGLSTPAAVDGRPTLWNSLRAKP